MSLCRPIWSDFGYGENRHRRVNFSEVAPKYSIRNSKEPWAEELLKVLGNLEIAPLKPFKKGDKQYEAFKEELRDHMVDHLEDFEISLNFYLKNRGIQFRPINLYEYKHDSILKLWQRVEHPETMAEYMHHYSHVLRLPMADWIQSVIEREDLKIKLPDEYLVEVKTQDKIPEYRRYMVASKELPVLPVDRAEQLMLTWSSQRQVKFVRHVCHLIRAAGLMDTNLSNWGLVDPARSSETVIIEGEKFPAIYLLDTEPHAFLTETSDRPKKRLSLLEASIVGLKVFGSRKGCERLSKEAREEIFRWQRQAEEKQRSIMNRRLCALMTCFVYPLCCWCCHYKKQEEKGDLDLPLLKCPPAFQKMKIEEDGDEKKVNGYGSINQKS